MDFLVVYAAILLLARVAWVRQKRQAHLARIDGRDALRLRRTFPLN